MKTRRKLLALSSALACVTLAGIASPAAHAASGVSGISPNTWVLIQPDRCFHQILPDTSYFYIINYDGVQLWTSEPDIIAGLIPVCSGGFPFFVYSVDGVNWSYSTYAQFTL